MSNKGALDGNNSDSLFKKEEEYRLMNAKLEEKTANLVLEAERVLKDNDIFMGGGDLQIEEQAMNSIEITRNDEKAMNADATVRAEFDSVVSRAMKKAEKDGSASEDEENNGQSSSKANILTSNLTSKPTLDDIMPPDAHEMGTEAQLRFLKAKLRVMSEEVQRLNNENIRRTQEVASLTTRIKEAEEDKLQQSKITHQAQQQLDKLRRQLDEAKSKGDTTETNLAIARKETDALKRDRKKLETDFNTASTRLQRASEEVERLKTSLAASKTSARDTVDGERKRIEQLTADNKRLERQKGELIQAFRKQNKLVDVLKKQKVHMEAMKMLQFTEDEFVKALDWGSSSN